MGEQWPELASPPNQPPAFPGSMPFFPSMPGMNMPGMDAMPGGMPFLGVPGMPSIPGMPPMPGMPGGDAPPPPGMPPAPGPPGPPPSGDSWSGGGDSSWSGGGDSWSGNSWSGGDWAKRRKYDNGGDSSKNGSNDNSQQKWEDWDNPGGNSGGGGGNKPPQRRTTDITATVEIPVKGVKDVMGVHGNNIRKIQQISGVYKVKLLDQAEVKTKSPDEWTTVEIVGAAAAVEVAKKMVMAVAEGDQSCIGNVEEVMELEPRLVSKIIGTGGEVIQQMQKSTNTRLAIRSGARGSNQLPKLIMIGPPENVAQARAVVEEYIRQHEGRPSQETRIVTAEEEVNEAWPWQMSSGGWSIAEAASNGVSQTDMAAAVSATMANWPAQSGAPGNTGAPAAAPTDPAAGAGAAGMPDFAAVSAAAMEYAQQMAAMSMQQMLMGMATETASQAAAKEEEKQVETKAANLATSLRDKLLKNRPPKVDQTPVPAAQAAVVQAGEAKLGMSLRDKLLANRRKADPAANAGGGAGAPRIGEEFQIALAKTEGCRIGIITSSEYEIEAINEGLVQAWNAMHKEPQIKIGDYIKEVNGIRGNIPNMRLECKKNQMLTMKILRTEKSRP